MVSNANLVNPTPMLAHPDHTSTYPLEKLMSLWKRGDLSTEQMAGHLLQHLTLQEKRLRHLEKNSPHGAAYARQVESEHVVN